MPVKMTSALLPDLGTQIVIPVCAVIGIIFSLIQWVLVARVKLSPERNGSTNNNNSNNKNGYNDYLIEEEEGINDPNVVVKCAEIQNAISEGEIICFLFTSLNLCISVSDLFAFYSVFVIFCLVELKQ